MNVLEKAERVSRFFLRHAKGKSRDFREVPDCRQQAKVTWPLSQVLQALVFGVLSHEPTVRDVEEFCRRLGSWARKWIPGVISDSTLDSIARQVDPVSLHDHLGRQVRELPRKNLLPPHPLPCGVATVDGKHVATLTQHAEDTAQPRQHADGRPYWRAMALRSTLTSAVSKPGLAHMPRPVGTTDMGAYREFVERLHPWDGRSPRFESLDLDSGVCSLNNANSVNALGEGSSVALKDNQPEVLAEATRGLRPLAHQPRFEAETPWEWRNGHWTAADSTGPRRGQDGRRL